MVELNQNSILVKKKNRRRQQPNPNWPLNFIYPLDKLHPRLQKKLKNHQKNLKCNDLQKGVIKALFCKIKDDLNM